MFVSYTIWKCREPQVEDHKLIKHERNNTHSIMCISFRLCSREELIGEKSNITYVSRTNVCQIKVVNLQTTNCIHVSYINSNHIKASHTD